MFNFFINYYNRIFKYKDLLFVFVWREFSVRYNQTIIGILWAVLQPLTMMCIFTFIFTFMIEANVTDYPYALFFYTGILPWTLFDSSVKYSVPSFSAHYNLITKIYFPREIIPLSCIFVAVVDYFISFLFLLILMFLFNSKISLFFLWTIPLTIMLIIFTVSISIILSSMNVFYRDVKIAIGFVMQVWFFVTPVFYSSEKLIYPYDIIVKLNPMVFFVENFRNCTLYNKNVDVIEFTCMAVFVVILFVCSMKVFTKIERMFADVI